MTAQSGRSRVDAVLSNTRHDRYLPEQLGNLSRKTAAGDFSKVELNNEQEVQKVK